jgi:hypothetical protein
MENAMGRVSRLRVAILCMAALSVWTLFGCGKKSAPSEEVPIAMADSLEHLTPRADAGDSTATAMDRNGSESESSYAVGGAPELLDASDAALPITLEVPINPTRGDRLAVRFALPTAERAQLELFDLSGRRIASRQVSGPGRQEVALGEGRRMGPGVYFIQLTQGPQVARTRVVVIE